jgi:xanthine dehydrogenase accessory factor
MSDWLSGWRAVADGSDGVDVAADFGTDLTTDFATEFTTILVTVASVQGSVPREAGAKMLVGRVRQFGTIGGGHLELRALQVARAMLQAGTCVPGHIERFALGPSLGQCCGGAVHLAFEPCVGALAAVLDGLQQRRRLSSWRRSALGVSDSSESSDSVASTASAALFDAAGQLLVGSHAATAPLPLPEHVAGTGTRVVQDGAGRRWLFDWCPAPRHHLMLFGAGHVGSALVNALAGIDCHVTWVDPRADQFPTLVPANVTVEVTDVPEDLIEQAPAGSSFLVMTHSHALDFSLIEAIIRLNLKRTLGHNLKRNGQQNDQRADEFADARTDACTDPAWFGLIGSITKRRQFEHRLQARGAAPDQIAAMVCPIGLPGISGKEPAVIAASVCCQLLMQWQRQQQQQQQQQQQAQPVA